MVLEITFGGASASAYETLSSQTKHKFNLLLGTASRASYVITPPRMSEKTNLLLVDNEGILSFSEVEYLSQKIKRLGKNKATILLSRFGSIESIKNASYSQLRKISGIGDTLANRIINDL